MLFVAANDLLIMFVALEVLQPAALPDLRAGPPPAPAVAGGGGQVLPAGRLRLGVLPVRPRAGLRRRRHRAALGDPRGRRRAAGGNILLVLGLALLVVGLLFKVSVAPFHTWTPDVYQGAPTPVTAFMAACTKIAAFGAILRAALRRLRHAGVDLAAADLRRRDRLDGRRRGPRPHPDRPQAHARLLLDRARRASCSPASSGSAPAARAPACPRRCSTCSPTASRRWAPSPSSRWCATATARPRTCPSGRGWPRGRR